MASLTVTSWLEIMEKVIHSGKCRRQHTVIVVPQEAEPCLVRQQREASKKKKDEFSCINTSLMSILSHLFDDGGGCL